MPCRYVYATADIVSDQIAASGSWEADMTAQMVHKLALFAEVGAHASCLRIKTGQPFTLTKGSTQRTIGR